MNIAKEPAQAEYPKGIEDVGNNENCHTYILKTPQATKPTHTSNLKAANINVLLLEIKAILYTVL